MVHIRMLGGFSVIVGDRSVRFATAKTGALAAYLLYHPDQWIPRTKLWCLLWPDSPEKKAASNLRQTLYRLRHAFAEVGMSDLLEGRRGALQLSSKGVDLHIDAKEFEAQAFAAVGDSGGDVTRLAKAVALYTGVFLDGMEGDWIDEQRLRLDHLYLMTLKRSIVMLRDAGLHETVVSQHRPPGRA